MKRRRKNTPGKRLQELRQALGFSMRDVVKRSRLICKHRKDRRYLVSLSVLSGLESDQHPPRIHTVGSLAQIYGKSPSKLLMWYDIR